MGDKQKKLNLPPLDAQNISDTVGCQYLNRPPPLVPTLVNCMIEEMSLWIVDCMGCPCAWNER